MFEILDSAVGWANGYIWGTGMLVLIVGSGLFFSFRLGFFQFTHFIDMWSNVNDKNSSESGISTFASFWTTMAVRVGTGNVVGVAVAIYLGGPGAMFWMILTGMTNSAVCFVECSLAQLYKVRVGTEYRGGGAYCAERGLGWRKYGMFTALLLAIATSMFMPAAATFTIADAFYSATGIPMIATSAFIAVSLFVIIIGGIKRISTIATLIVPFMTAAYMILTLAILIVNFDRIPSMLYDVVTSAFGMNAVVGAGIGVAIQQGVKRGTFSSASGMGEIAPTAAAAETSHPIKVGMANAAGVWLDTVVVCTCSGLMLLLTDTFNTSYGYVGSGAPELVELAETGTNGVIFISLAARSILGSFADIFIAIMLLLFSFTCIISYYYEAESSAMYFFQKEGSEKGRAIAIKFMQIAMPILVFFWGIIESHTAWNISDLALGSCTWVNMLILWMLFPRCVALYKDYRVQKDAKQDPFYNPKKLTWKGVDVELWSEINKNKINKQG